VSVCVSASSLDPSSIYPVLDPRRTGGNGTKPFFQYGYQFAWDAIRIIVERAHTLSSCAMEINFTSDLAEGKEIQAWNLFDNNFVDHVGSSSLGLKSSMVIQKAGQSGQPCNVGTDTVVLCRQFAWPRLRTALYSFAPQDFWDFWGGCAVTFDWVADAGVSGPWGNQTPQPTYPLLILPDRTVMSDSTGPGKFVILGGAAFPADDAYLAGMGLSNAAAQPFSISVPATPADFTLVREINQQDTYIVFGGAKFLIPHVSILGIQIPGQIFFPFNPNDVKVIPSGGTAQLRTVPGNGTLVKELNDSRVYLADLNQLRLVTSPAVMDAHCLPQRHIRVVPPNTLAGLPRGADII
jgi:hypothetical protein